MKPQKKKSFFGSRKSEDFLGNKTGMSSVIATVLLISITIAILGIVFAFVIPFIQDSMAKSKYCFDANQAVYIKSVCHSTNDGALINGPIWNSTGKIGGAYQIYGIGGTIPGTPGMNSYINVKNTPELNFGTNDFALEAWIRSTTDTYANQAIIAKWNGSGSYNQAYWLAVYNKRFSFGVYNFSNNNQQNLVYSLDEMRTSRWYHVIAERKKINETHANISISINGQLDNSLIVPLFNVDNEETLKIGVDSPLNNPWYFDGMIDEVKIYNRALTSSEILQNYNSDGMNYVKEGLVSYWTFDENTPGITKDKGNIKIKISRGSEKIVLSKLLFILKNKDGTSTYTPSFNLQPYEEGQYQFAGLVNITSVQIAPIVSDGTREITCDPNPSFKNIGDC